MSWFPARNSNVPYRYIKNIERRGAWVSLFLKIIPPLTDSLTELLIVATPGKTGSTTL